MRVMQEAEQRRPALRRLGDQLGAWYTPLALAIAVRGLVGLSGDPVRFLAVVVVATPCPLLIAIPVAIIGAISTAARRGIVIKDPAALEQLTLCRTMILDKTGTLTYGRPRLTDEVYGPGFSRDTVLPLVAALRALQPSSAGRAHRQRRGPRRPGAAANVEWIREEAGAGLRGRVAGLNVLVTSRARARRRPTCRRPPASGLECVVLVDDRFAACLRFNDVPRSESRRFIDHLSPRHGVTRVMIVSGDRETEVRRLADGRGDRRGSRRDVAGGEAGDRPSRDARERRRSSSATASTTPRR